MKVTERDTHCNYYSSILCIKGVMDLFFPSHHDTICFFRFFRLIAGFYLCSAGCLLLPYISFDELNLWINLSVSETLWLAPCISIYAHDIVHNAHNNLIIVTFLSDFFCCYSVWSNECACFERILNLFQLQFSHLISKWCQFVIFMFISKNSSIIKSSKRCFDWHS